MKKYIFAILLFSLASCDFHIDCECCETETPTDPATLIDDLQGYWLRTDPNWHYLFDDLVMYEWQESASGNGNNQFSRFVYYASADTLICANMDNDTDRRKYVVEFSDVNTAELTRVGYANSTFTINREF